MSKYTLHLEDEEWMYDTQQPDVIFCKSQSGNGWYVIADEADRGSPTSCSCPGWGYRSNCRHFEKAQKVWGNFDKGIPIPLDDDDENWIALRDVIGTDKVPHDAGAVIKQAIQKMLQRDEVSSEAPWMAIEFWAADYLGE